MTSVGHGTVLAISNDFNMRSLQPSSEVCCPLQMGLRRVLDAPRDFIFVVRVSQVRRNRVATVDTQSLPHTNQCSHSRNQASEYIIEPKACYNSSNSESRSQKLKRKQTSWGREKYGLVGNMFATQVQGSESGSPEPLSIQGRVVSHLYLQHSPHEAQTRASEQAGQVDKMNQWCMCSIEILYLYG